MPQIDFQKEVLYYLTVLISTVMTGIAYKIFRGSLHVGAQAIAQAAGARITRSSSPNGLAGHPGTPLLRALLAEADVGCRLAGRAP